MDAFHLQARLHSRPHVVARLSGEFRSVPYAYLSPLSYLTTCRLLDAVRLIESVFNDISNGTARFSVERARLFSARADGTLEWPMILHGMQHVLVRQNSWRLAGRMKTLVRTFHEEPSHRSLLLPAIYSVGSVLQCYRDEMQAWASCRRRHYEELRSSR